MDDWQRAPGTRTLPRQRGLLFGWLLDARLRQASAGKTSLVDVLRGMRADEPDPAATLVAAIQSAGGGDITPLLDKYIIRGELLQLPAGAMGPCMKVETQTDPYGWQVQRVADACTASRE